MIYRMLKFYNLTSKKIIRIIVRWLQPGAERFYCYNGRLLYVSPNKKSDTQRYYCNFCLKPAKRSEQHDRYACMNCNLWLENLCLDQKCLFCYNKTPLTPAECRDLRD